MDNSKIIEEFRKNHGKVGGPFAQMKLLLLIYMGSKTGKEYTKPLAYTLDGDKYVIIASKGGADSNPEWYYNLLKNPYVKIEVGDEKLSVEAKEAKGEERERLSSI